MGKSKWPDFLFTVAVRLFCGLFLGGLLCVLIGYRGILSSFAHNHIRAAGVWVGLWALVGGLVAVLTTPRWQTPWYKGIHGPSSWRDINAGMTRQNIIERVGQPSNQSDLGEDVWHDGDWELRVRYNQNEEAIGIVRQTVLE